MTTGAATPANVEAERGARLRAKLERWFTVTPAMLHSIDAAGRLVAVSDAWLAKLGYRREEVIGKSFSDFLTPESREHAIKNVFPEFFRHGRCENVEYQIVGKDGRAIDVLLSSILDDDPTGRGRASLAVITDVTALRVAERKLAESEARYRGLVEDQTELVSLATPEGLLRYVNHAYARHYGKQPDEMVGKSLFDFVPPEARAAVAEHLQRVCRADRSVENENQVILPDGRTRWMSWTNRALRDGEGKVTAIHSIGRDVEQRVAAERRLRESEARYRGLVEDQSDIVSLMSPEGELRYVNDAHARICGWRPEEMVGRSFFDFVPEEARACIAEHMQSVCRAEGAIENENQVILPDGRTRWMSWTNRALRDGEGRVTAIHSVGRDVEQRVAAERRLKESEARYRLLAEHSTDMVLELDLDLKRRYVSPACREIFGYEPEEMIGGTSGAMAHPEDAERLAQVLQSLLDGRVDRHSVIVRRRHRDGHWIWVEAQYRALKDPVTGALTGIIGSVRDISARKAVEDQLAEAYRRLEALAREDGLTGLANRRTFDDALSKEFRRARRDNQSLGLIMIDVDCFKAFNDRYGHPAGDECLRRIGKTLANTVFRPGDLAARYGGEEFAVLLPGADEHGAAMIGERIRQAVLHLAIEHEGCRRRIMTVSAGAASTGRNAFEGGPEALLQHADRALYRAKDGGRNAVVRASSLRRPGAMPSTAA